MIVQPRAYSCLARTTIDECRVEVYEKSIQFEFGDTFYLFPMASSFERGLSSSAWTQSVKQCFDRWSGVAAPPWALIRDEFIRFINSFTVVTFWRPA